MNPPDPDAPFAEPWQAQAFALTVALHDAGRISWSDWTQALGRELAAGTGYWEAWVAALERITAGHPGADRAGEANPC